MMPAGPMSSRARDSGVAAGQPARPIHCLWLNLRRWTRSSPHPRLTMPSASSSLLARMTSRNWPPRHGDLKPPARCGRFLSLSRLAAQCNRFGDDSVVTIGPADGACVRIGFAHEHPLVAGESARMRCNPRNHVADLGDLRLENSRLERHPVRGKVEPGSTVRRRAVAATAAPAQREEARRQLGRSLARPGSRLATGSTARQTSWRVLDSRRRRP
jgi:hypothetical protein